MPKDEKYRTYDEAGVSISEGDKCSSIAYRACLETYENRKGRFGQPKEIGGSFSAPVSIDVSAPDTYLVKNSDGVGSKALIAQKMDHHKSLGFDLVAMNVDDAASIGAEPFVGTNSLDIAKAEPELVKELMSGLVQACEQANLAMIGGEIAELPDQLKGFGNPYIWNADIIGVMEKDKKIDGSKIRSGDSIVSVRSRGMRSNGFTLARKILGDTYGNEWEKEKGPERSSWGEVLLKPSVICTPAITKMVGRYGEGGFANVSGVVHLTGGGLENLKRVLPSHLGAELVDLYEPHDEMVLLQEMGPVSDREAYRTWNMGQCLLIITDQPDEVIGLSEELGLECKKSGKVVKSDKIQVKGKGREGKEFDL